MRTIARRLGRRAAATHMTNTQLLTAGGAAVGYGTMLIVFHGILAPAVGHIITTLAHLPAAIGAIFS